MAGYVVSSGSLFEDFETPGDWTAANGTIASDSTYVRTGSKSMKVTSAVSGNCHMTKTINVNMSRSGILQFWVHLPTLDGLDHVVIWLSSSTSLTSSFNYSRYPVHSVAGWNLFTIAKGDWTNSGSECWDNTMVRLRFSVYATSGNQATAYFDSVYTGVYSRPKCIFTFDDAVKTGLTNGKAYMDRYGLKGTFYVPSTYVGSTGTYGTVAEFQAAHAQGWDVSNHTKTHQRLDQITEAEILTELRDCQAFLIENGFTRNNSHKHFCYPNGGYNDTAIGVLTSEGFITSTTTERFTQPNHVIRPHRVSRYNLDSTSDSLTDIKGFIDAAIARGGTCILCFHHIVTTPATSEMSIANFQAIVDYVVSKRDQIDVVSITEWYRGLTNPRRVV